MTDWFGDRFREGMSAWMEAVPGLAQASAGMLEQTAEVFGFTPATAFGQVIDIARRRLIGRPATFDLDGAELTMTLETIDVVSSPIGPAIGQLGDITVAARDVRWKSIGVERVDAVLHNVHVQPRSEPVLVIAPVTFRIVVGADEVQRHFESTSVARRATLELGDGVVTLRHRARPGLGSVDGILRAVDDHVRVDVDEIRAANRWNLGQKLRSAVPSVRLPLPRVLHGRVRTIEVGPEAIVVTGLAGEFREVVRAEQVDTMRRRLTGFDGRTVVVPRSPETARADDDR